MDNETCESQLHLSGLTSQESRYHHVVLALSLAAADEVYGILAQPSATASYDLLKAALLQRTEASDLFRLQKPLLAEELGDRRPSQPLRRMTQLLGDRANTIGDALLRELFIQRLPINFQMVLATATALNLRGLAALADTFIQVATPPVASVTIWRQKAVAKRCLPCQVLDRPTATSSSFARGSSDFRLGGSNPECHKVLRQYLQDESRDKRDTDLDVSDWTFEAVKTSRSR
ncbi:hypothetical protein HPB47_023727 [Ixodes persulcatus]|uniref:Uncharacterized protein n=1 Tax=Ixodes persulcatus TaxID=34615 RepID=A0AC60Q658_IXOPE|nr:hypothetical protein HPB47_023727 [Ixodes persulcatus]